MGDWRIAARRALVVVIGVAALALMAPGGAEAKVNFTLKGKWTCNNRGTTVPIQGARIELWHDISYWPDDKITTRHLDASGNYNIGISADDNFKLYVKIVLNDDNGVKLQNWYSPFDWETETGHSNSHSGTVDLGTWQISHDNGSGTPKCAVWQGAHNAYKDYQAVIGSRPPDNNYRVDAEFPCCGTPFTTTDVTRWPANYDVRANYEVNFHEFAHSFRHSFDGNTTHFLFDAARFTYPQTHTSCKVTNQGFAFNEGWAEYWAHTPQTCGDGTNLSQEGNVAVLLTGLEKCSSRPSMVSVLRQSPGSIHSYTEFKNRFDQLFPRRLCTAPVLAQPAEGLPTLSAAAIQSDILKQIAAQKKLVASLSNQASRAKRQAAHPGKCKAGHCQAALENLIDPSAMSTQAAQAKLVLGQLQEGLAAAQKAKFDPSFMNSTFVKQLDANRDDFQKDNQKLLVAGLTKSIKEIKTQPGFKRGRSTGLYKTLNSRLDAIANARKKGKDTPASVESLYAPPVAELEGARKVKGK